MTTNSDTPSSISSILEGQYNFRDLGGLPAGNGFQTRSGMIYRSGDLNSITDTDIALMEKIGLALIIDFRSERERIHRPNREIPSVRKIRTLPINDSARETAMEYIAENNAAELENVLISDYRRIIRENQEEYRQFLNELASTPYLPLVFHCTAGKDRTGLAAVFLLTALGVEFNSVFQDYTASNIYNAERMAMIINRMNETGRNGEIIRPLLEIKKEYLDAALAEISENYGGLHNFVIDTLKADVTRLKERFLKPVTRHT
jgi:protein-tyrosine phosphatase